eukprot:scaffold79864_cov46-Attheya_sp.AAC.2
MMFHDVKSCKEDTSDLDTFSPKQRVYTSAFCREEEQPPEVYRSIGICLRRSSRSLWIRTAAL